MTTRLSHRDCRNYAPIDVTRGLCHRTKDLVPGDAEGCDAFLLMPKCNNCKLFSATPGAVELGTCGASDREPKFFAYPDMVAVTCGMHQPR
jgi:4-hydroxyphenylacetate decarboxylase small subunit